MAMMATGTVRPLIVGRFLQVTSEVKIKRAPAMEIVHTLLITPITISNTPSLPATIAIL